MIRRPDRSKSVFGVNRYKIMKEEASFDTAFNSYRVVGILGEGGSGKVYKVVDESGKEYALKCLEPQKATTEKLKRFKNELFFCLQNRHKNIITVQDHGTAIIKGVKSPFYVMPYYPGLFA